MQKIELSIESRLNNVSLIGVTVNKICSKIKIDHQTCCQIELCVVEAVNQCIMHAYQNNPGKYVKIAIELEKENICFKICDTGRLMNSFKDMKSDLSFDPEKSSSLPETDMGIYIINNIMDTVSYKCINGINTLTMTKHVKDLQLPEHKNPPF
ncbi:Histidine kinase [Desulfonema limicola]|uniref:Histidine kinase n=1 Tax=Desulfonema limicola TaxID=45656 RepID=A0A975B5R3_9BACT|nr:ATP-binding protein [Desulfonema limicola]QTA79254.1 Histidine kinase [Desulfonema limicola]